MSRLLAFAAVLTLAGPAAPALAQAASDPAASPITTAAPAAPAPPAAAPAGVEVAPLAAPDAFSTAGRATGLGVDLWRGASVDTLSAVLPKLAARPLSPAAAALARRVLATGAPGPQGLGADPKALADRAAALTALGDARAAAAILARAPGLDASSELSRTAAESALLAGDDARACSVADALTVGRDEIYWLRLRTYCEAIRGHAPQAQLTFQLAQTQAPDPVFGRLLGAKLAGAGDPGAPSLRNGLDLALSRSLGLDLSRAKPAPAVAAALGAAEPSEPGFTVPAGDADRLTAARALAAGQPLAPELVGRMLDAGVKGDAASQAAALIVAAYAGVSGPDLRGRFAALAVPEGRAPAGRSLALAEAGRERLQGEAAMLSLWTCAEAPAGGLAVADRARMVQALRQAGLDQDARNFAVEGLLAP